MRSLLLGLDPRGAARGVDCVGVAGRGLAVLASRACVDAGTFGRARAVARRERAHSRRSRVRCPCRPTRAKRARVLGELEALLSPSELAALRARPDTQALLVARDGRPAAGNLCARHGRRHAHAGTRSRRRAARHRIRLRGARRADTLAGRAARAVTCPSGRTNARGAITLRQALWELRRHRDTAADAWNPFVRAARLASGPDFDRAAPLAHRRNYPAGSHFARAPANAQVLALALVRATSTPLAEYVQRTLWSPIGAGEAWFALDRVGGRAAAHCCMRATARDWLRVGMLLERSGPSDASADATADPRLPAGWLAEMTRASAGEPRLRPRDRPRRPPPLGALHLAGHGPPHLGRCRAAASSCCISWPATSRIPARADA